MPGRTTPSGAVDIEIADTGEGIAQSDLPRLFDVGFTRRVGGTGLGLAIVRQVVNQHHGHIEVHSEVGIGTTVILYLPLGAPPREAWDAATAH
jgi:signal transduction histidine kinase